MTNKHKDIMRDAALTRLIKVTRNRLGSKGRDFDKEHADHLKKAAQFRILNSLRKHKGVTTY